ncbi:MAG: fibronectin type III domain-containing protein [Myxococcales bacterium]|nr:fibronectin type III domain-containing protein [Myxococcales bacterium]
MKRLLPLLFLATACGDNGALPGPAPTNPLVAETLTGRLVSPTQIDLSWTSESEGQTGAIIERRGPHDAGFTQIATVGANVTTYSDTDLVGGMLRYRVLTISEAGQSPRSNVAEVAVPLAAQTATLSSDVATHEVTVTSQPENFNLSGSVREFITFAPGAPLGLALRVQNSTGRPVFNLKAVVTSVSDGMSKIGIGAHGNFAGSPFIHFGNAGIDIGATRTQYLGISGYDDTATSIDLEITLVDSPVVLTTDSYSGGNLYASDLSGVGFVTELDINQFTFGGKDGNSNTMRGVVSPDGRYAYYGLRNQPAVLVVDLTTLTPMVGPSLVGTELAHDTTGAVGMTRAVTMSPDGMYLYVTLMTEMHAYECSTSSYDGTEQGDIKDPASIGTIEVVKLDRATLAEVDRAVLLTGVSEAQGRELTLSADGSRGAIAIKVNDEGYGVPAEQVHGRFFVINTSDMSIVDGDDAADFQSFDVSAYSAKVYAATISPDGTSVYVLTTSDDSPLVNVEIATGTATPVDGHGLSGDLYTKNLTFGPDGRLYWMDYYVGGHIFAPGASATEGTWTHGLDTNVRDIAFIPSTLQYVHFLFNDSSAKVYDLATDALVNSESDDEAARWIGNLAAHSSLVTPF